jgi:hypothetical protein
MSCAGVSRRERAGPGSRASLFRKAEQASAADSWLRADVRDGIWQFTRSKSRSSTC